MKTKIIPILAVLVMLLAGCAAGPERAAAKAGIRAVRIDPHVDSQQGMRYGVDLSGGGLANMLASALIDSAGQKGITRMSVLMQANHIVVADMVRERFEHKVRQNPGFTVVDGAEDGVFFVSVVQFGFDDLGFGSSKKVPFILLSGELRDNQGKRVWRRQSSPLQASASGMGTKWEEYEADPEKLRADWTTQIDGMLGKLFPESK